jgi:hypothetical protein
MTARIFGTARETCGAIAVGSACIANVGLPRWRALATKTKDFAA